MSHIVTATDIVVAIMYREHMEADEAVRIVGEALAVMDFHGITECLAEGGADTLIMTTWIMAMFPHSIGFVPSYFYPPTKVLIL